jgi:hypothetical protein
VVLSRYELTFLLSHSISQVESIACSIFRPFVLFRGLPPIQQMKGRNQMKRPLFLASTIFALAILSGHTAQAQEPGAPSKIEVGVQFSSLTLSQQSPFFGGLDTVGRGNTEAGFGGRFSFNLNKNIALEAEGNFFPHENFDDSASSGRLLQGQFGVKAGKRFGKFGIFGKARPGFASFSKALTQVGTITIDLNGQPVAVPVFGSKRRTHFSMDLGGVLEFYPSRKVLTRIDIGDTIIHYGSGSFFPSGLSLVSASRTSHNLQLSAGIGFRLGSIQPEETNPQAHQEQKQRFEVGAQFSSLSFTLLEHSTGFAPLVPPSVFRDTQTQAGFGGRFTFNVTPNFALEAQGDFFPRDSTLFNTGRAGGRTLQGQAGIKAGKRFEKFGIFGKVRPGLVSFSKTLSFDGFDTSQPFPFPIFHLKRSTYFSMDLGGVLEFYPSPRIVTRFDGGDTMIRYGSIELPFPLNPSFTPAETIHSFEFSAGVGFRF